MSDAQTFYEGHSFYEGLTWWSIRERIGQGLRERYQVPNEPPAELLALDRKLEAIESKSPRARTFDSQVHKGQSSLRPFDFQCSDLCATSWAPQRYRRHY